MQRLLRTSAELRSTQDIEQDMEQLNRRVALEIFGLPPAVVDDFDFPLPDFANNRQLAISVLEKLMCDDNAVAAFNQALAAMENGWLRESPPLHFILLGITPMMICRAALSAVNRSNAAQESI